MALKVLRDNLKKLFWVLWIVIAALVVLIFFEWGGYGQYGTAGGDVAATVGDEEISFGELQQAYRNLQNRYREAFGGELDSEMEKQLGLGRQALSQLVNRRILLGEARKVGLETTDEEVRDAILNFPVFKNADGRFVGAEQYQQILASNRLSVEEFEGSMRQDILLTKLDTILASTAFISEEAVEKAYREDVEKAKIRFVQLPAAQMDEPEVDPEALAAHLAENPDDFEVPEKRVVDYLLVDTNQLRQAMEITDERLRSYYDENTDQYTREEQVRARHILIQTGPDATEEAARGEAEETLARIQAGEDFAALARELSDDPGSAANGGVLRPFGRGEMVPEFEQAAFGATAGELVGPVKSSFGFHIIEVQSKTEGGLQPFEEVQASIRARLLTEDANQEAETKALDLAGRISENATEEELRALAEEEGLELQTTEPFGQTDPVPGIGATRSFNLSVFELEEGEISEPLRIPRGWAIIRLKEIQAPRIPALDEVEDEVRRAVVQERQKEAAIARLEEAAGSDLDTLADQLGVSVQESAEFGRGGQIAGLGQNREVIEAALGMEIGEMGGPIATDAGAVVFEIVERQSFDPETFAGEKAATRAQLEQERLQEIKGTLIEKRKRELETSVDPSVMENFGIVEI